MNLQEFLSLVTPDVGIKYVTVIHQKTSDKQKFNQVENVPYSTLDKGVELIQRADKSRRVNVYFSCASYAQAEYKGANGKRKTRTAENAISARAIWRDLDVGLNDKGKPKPNAYESKADAVTAVAELCEKLSLPSPVVVSSGNGIHVYWPFNRDVPKDEWRRLADVAREVFSKLGLKSDPARDCDIASVLRPPGTYNKGKSESSAHQLVEVLATADTLLDPDGFAALLAPYDDQAEPADQLDEIPEYMRGVSVSTEALAKQREYPPSYAEIAATKCAQIARFKETGGTGYQTWWLGIGFCKHTVEGAEKAHEWSAKHVDYSKAETQEKFDDWEKGPPTCEAFSNAEGLCSKCEFKDKIRSPIALGYDENPPPQEIEVDTDEDIAEKITLPERYAYRNGYMSQLVMVDGKAEYHRITKTLFWFEGRFWATSGEIVYSVVSRVRQNKKGTWQYRHFDLPAGIVGKGGIELYGALGQNEIFVTDKGAKTRMDALVAAMAEQLKQRVDEVRAYRTFGWQDDGGFLIGDQRIHNGVAATVKVAGESAPSYLPGFVKNGGDAREWSNIVQAMYAHPHHTSYQLVVLFGIGSPLLRFYQMPTGCLINTVGEKGTGKTTAARVGLSAYGDPNILMTTLNGTTELALYNRLATLHSIPCSVDEMTNVEPLKASNMLYSIMNGQPRDGMKSDGKRRDQLVPWQTVTFGSANSSIVELLATFKGNASAEMSRLIELDWPRVKTIERRDMDTLLEYLREHYGSIGFEFVKWISQNEKKAEGILFKTRELIEDQLQIGKEHRFWSAHIAVPFATKLILDEIGLLSEFNIDELLTACIATVTDQKTSVATLTMSNIEAFNSMVNSYSDRVISTRTLKDSRLATPDGVIMSGEPVGRAVVDEDVFYLSVPAIRQWCTEKRMSYKTMRRELMDLGVLDAEERFYLGRGTTRVTGQTYCWRMNLSKVQGYSSAATSITEAGHLKLVKS